MHQSIPMVVLSTLLLLVVGLGTSANAAPDPDKPMNVVIFLVDDYGWADTSYNGSTFYETKNIDTGTVFTDGYAASPVCSPTRAAIMAGKYPHRMDTTDWFGAPQPEAIAGGKVRYWTRNKTNLEMTGKLHALLKKNLKGLDAKMSAPNPKAK